MIIPFTLNHQQVYVDVPRDRRLASILREIFGSKGTQFCCQDGYCGKCLVIWENKIANACLIPMGAMPYTDVLTLEGFKNTPVLDSILLTFQQNNITLCPYCKSARILSIINLLHEAGKAAKEEILETIETVRCSCTNYDALENCIANLTLIKENYE